MMKNDDNDQPLNIRIVSLDPMRIIVAYGFGGEPERIAWSKIQRFVEEKGIAKENTSFRTFGFNHPGPSPGSPNYGYEIWLPVPEDVEPEGDLRVEKFPGGLYAVTTFQSLQNIGKVWSQLAKWRETSKYHPGHHQWLEELLSPPNTQPENYVFNLYLPIST